MLPAHVMAPSLTIHLTNRPPVTVLDHEWPVVARVVWFDGPIERASRERAWVRVREHADGRRIVYGLCERPNQRAMIGTKLAAGDRTGFVEAVNASCGFCGLDPQRLFDDMPSEEM